MKVRSSEQERNDEADLQKLGYVQELFRGMGGFSNFAISFSVISILTGAVQLYGYGLQHGGPLQMTLGWLLVSFFTGLVAISMAELASSYPTSGALYHWSSFLGGRAWGWFTACFNTVGQFALLAGIDYGLAQLILGLGGWPPSYLDPLYLGLLISHGILNHIGIKVVAVLNNFSAWYHMIVLFLLVGALLVRGLNHPFSFLFTFHSADGYPRPYSFLIGLLLAQWTLTGFDASAHVSEETINPRQNAPWGVFLAVVVSVVFGLLMLGILTLSLPDLAQATAYGENAFSDVLKLRLGENFGFIMNALVLGAMWLCGLSSMTSSSRMVYAFARDGGLPFSKFWAHVSPRFRTPANAIWGLALFSMVLAIRVRLYSAVVSVAVIALYLSYGLPVAARIYTRWKNKPDDIGPWNVGKMSSPIAWVALLWIGVITIVFVIPPNQIAGKVMLKLTIFLFVFWFAFVKKRFAGPQYHPQGK